MQVHDPYAYLKDVLKRLPKQENHLIAELLPHRLQPLHAKHLFSHLVGHVNMCEPRAYNVFEALAGCPITNS